MRRLVLLTFAAFAALVGAAGAATVTSTNWSGYAAHQPGVHFKAVTASWRQPAATCSGGETSSAFWVGIGGYSKTAPAMEQIGTELDCNSEGDATISAWYELVPSSSRTIHLEIHAGDLISARVVVVGRTVTVSLVDHSRSEAFRRTTVASIVDTTSAEWIAEAPSDCSTSSDCATLALADFGTVQFLDASAQTTGGRTAGIAGSLWTTTKILLGYSGHGTAFVADPSTANATPSALTSAGHAFSVAYAAPQDTTTTDTGDGGGGNPGGDAGGGPGGRPPGGPPGRPGG